METTNAAQTALDAFNRDLPDLWQQRPGQWVAYRGGERVDFSPSKHLIYQQCYERGLRREDFVIFFIGPQETEMILGPLGPE